MLLDCFGISFTPGASYIDTQLVIYTVRELVLKDLHIMLLFNNIIRDVAPVRAIHGRSKDAI